MTRDYQRSGVMRSRTAPWLSARDRGSGGETGHGATAGDWKTRTHRKPSEQEQPSQSSLELGT